MLHLDTALAEGRVWHLGRLHRNTGVSTVSIMCDVKLWQILCAFLALKKGEMSTFNHALALVADFSAATLLLEPIFEDVRIVAYEKMCLSPVAHSTRRKSRRR